VVSSEYSKASAAAVQVSILRAERDVYAADIDGAVLIKIGSGHFAADESQWTHAESGHCWMVWHRK
jgi:hypothetical protein